MMDNSGSEGMETLVVKQDHIHLEKCFLLYLIVKGGDRTIFFHKFLKIRGHDKMTL